MCLFCGSIDHALVDAIPTRGLGSAPALPSAEGSSVFARNGSGSTTTAVTASSSQDINGLLLGDRWTLLSQTFAFPTLAAQYGSYSHTVVIDGVPTVFDETTTFQAFNATMQNAARSAFSLVNAYSTLNLTENTTTPGAATIRLGMSDTAQPTAYAYYPDNHFTGGDVWMGTQTSGDSVVNNPVIGNYAWHTHLHEVGHALGLKHGHEDGGVSNVAMTTAHDSMEYSLMTYRSYVGDPLDSGYTNETWGYAQTFMMYDIAALQYMYGADFTSAASNPGNSVYTFSTATGEMFISGVGQGVPGDNRIFRTIWDGDGIDTYDFSNYSSNQTIDLTPGGFSLMSTVQQANLGDGHFASGNVYNALQYQGDARSLIENANGGSGNDTIIGNAANNELRGNSGDDVMRGGAGNDTLIGGGNGTAGDTADLQDATGAVILTLDASGNAVVTATGIDTETLEGIENVTSGSGNDSLTGNTGANRFIGGLGNDTLFGGDGNDIIFATHADGDDQITAGNGFDILDFSGVNGVVQINQLAGTITGSAGNDTLLDVIEQIKGTAFNDVLSGGHGINVLDGEGGADQFFGNNGDDLMRGGEGDDTFFFSTSDGNDTLLGGSGFDILDYSSLAGVVQVNQLAGTTTGTANNDTLSDIFEQVIGTAFGDVLSGGHGINSLKGNGGDDQLFANNGDDYTSGGDGNDTITMGVGNDTHDFRNGEDVDTMLDFTAGGTEDTITLTFYSGLGSTSFDAAFQARLSTVSGHAELLLNGGDRIIFNNVASHTSLTAADFIF